PMFRKHWKDWTIEWHRQDSDRYHDKGGGDSYDAQARRDYLRLARWHAAEANRLEHVDESDSEERNRSASRARRARDLGQRVRRRWTRRCLADQWRPLPGEEMAAVREAMRVADWLGLTTVKPHFIKHEGRTRPRRWVIRYYAQSRYQRGTVRAVVSYKLGWLLEVDVELTSGT